MEITAKQAAEELIVTLDNLSAVFAKYLLANLNSEEEFNEAQKEAFETTRDKLSILFGISSLKAANMARIVMSLAKRKLGQEVDEEYLKGSIENAF